LLRDVFAPGALADKSSAAANMETTPLTDAQTARPVSRVDLAARSFVLAVSLPKAGLYVRERYIGEAAKFAVGAAVSGFCDLGEKTGREAATFERAAGRDYQIGLSIEASRGRALRRRHAVEDHSALVAASTPDKRLGEVGSFDPATLSRPRFWDAKFANAITRRIQVEREIAATAPTAPARRFYALAQRWTGVPAEFLAQVVAKESAGNWAAKPSDRGVDGTAGGPAQFIAATWAGQVHKYGDDFGMARLAAKDKVRAKFDPRYAIMQAALYSKDNAEALAAKGVANPTWRELRVVHFGGPKAGPALVKRARECVGLGRDGFSEKAVADNHGVFFDKDGRALTSRQTYNRLTVGMPNRLFQVSAVSPELSGPEI
jgi:hypothetical protein